MFEEQKESKLELNKYFKEQLPNGTPKEAQAFKIGWEKAFSLHGVSHQRELLKAYDKFLKSDEAKYYSGDFRIDEFLEAFNCG